jgi:uncharacterized protein (TIGR02118 family)
MFPILALIKRRPTSTRSAFRSYYESNHAPLARPLFGGIDRYVRYHIEEDLWGDVGFDVVTALWYRDEQEADRLFQRLDGPEGRAIRADELRFMDKPANRFFPVSERSWQDGEEADRSTFVFVRHPEGIERLEASREMERDHWPRLFTDPSTRGFALARDGLMLAEREPPFDSVMQLGADADASVLAKWADPLERAGWRVVAIRTARHESKLSSRAGDRVAR